LEKLTLENKNYPELLRKIKKPPEQLYALGDVTLLKSNCIAVVGSRHCSEYGNKMAAKFAKSLSESGITIVSGLAIRNRRSSA
jgi:DNA processing protein